jgi:hypothetical protein
MALGKIKADTLEHSTAGSLDTSYVVNGSAKAWLNLTGTGTATINGSLNISSIIDNGVGIYTENFSNSFASTSVMSFSGNASINLAYGQMVNANYSASTSSHKIEVHNQNVAYIDCDPGWSQGHGDLA